MSQTAAHAGPLALRHRTSRPAMRKTRAAVLRMRRPSCSIRGDRSNMPSHVILRGVPFPHSPPFHRRSLGFRVAMIASGAGFGATDPRIEGVVRPIDLRVLHADAISESRFHPLRNRQLSSVAGVSLSQKSTESHERLQDPLSGNQERRSCNHSFFCWQKGLGCSEGPGRPHLDGTPAPPLSNSAEFSTLPRACFTAMCNLFRGSERCFRICPRVCLLSRFVTSVTVAGPDSCR
jgi:hypothetical protein